MVRTRVVALAAVGIAIAAAASAAPLPASNPALTFDGVPPTATDADQRLAAYLESRPARALGFSPQGQVLIRSRFGDVDQLHLVAQESGARRQLTFGREPVAWAAFPPIRRATRMATCRTRQAMVVSSFTTSA